MLVLDLTLIKSILHQIGEKRGLEKEQIWSALESALAAAYKKEYRKKGEVVKAKISEETGEVSFYLAKTVVDLEDLENKKIKFNPDRQIPLPEAQKINPNIQVGEVLLIPLEAKKDFGRIAAQTAKQAILQKLKEEEKSTVYEEFKNKKGGIVSGIVQRVEGRNIYVDLGKTIGVMFHTETIPNEYYRIGERKRFYVYEVEKVSGGVKVYLSRANPLFLIKLFETEVPEISEGWVEIKGIARIPGVKTKIAVATNQPHLDPVGSCVGPRGARIISIMNELNNEKIDVIRWDEDPEQYVINALIPAKAITAELLEKRTVRVLVSEDQIPMAIGKNGENVKLAAKLTGWRIEIRSAERPEEKIEGGLAEVDDLSLEAQPESSKESNSNNDSQS